MLVTQLVLKFSFLTKFCFWVLSTIYSIAVYREADISILLSCAVFDEAVVLLLKHLSAENNVPEVMPEKEKIGGGQR